MIDRVVKKYLIEKTGPRDDEIMALIRTEMYTTKKLLSQESAWEMVRDRFGGVERGQFLSIWNTLLTNGFLVKKNKEKSDFKWAT